MEFSVSIESLEDLSIVYTAGELDAVTSSKLEEPLNGLIESGVTQIVLDLHEVPYISSAGLRVLLVIAQRLQDTGKLVLSRLTDDVREVMEMTGFTKIIETHDDLESAKTALHVWKFTERKDQ